jgi:hypothetical protein
MSTMTAQNGESKVKYTSGSDRQSTQRPGGPPSCNVSAKQASVATLHLSGLEYLNSFTVGAGYLLTGPIGYPPQQDWSVIITWTICFPLPCEWGVLVTWKIERVLVPWRNWSPLQYMWGVLVTWRNWSPLQYMWGVSSDLKIWICHSNSDVS